MSDPFDDFLARGFPCEPNDQLRHALRERTTRVLRRRRRWKQLGLVAALAGCFLAGMATMRLLVPPAPGLEEGPTKNSVVAEQRPEPAAPATLPQTARIMEWQARAQPDRRVERLRLAAKIYLEEEHDYAAALRCYTQALNAGGDQALEFSPNDTWLEMAIKDARRREKARAN